MSKGSSKTTVGFQYWFGMHALLGAWPINRIVRGYTDNQDLISSPASSGEIPINALSIYSGGEIADGIKGKIKLHLNGTPEFDSYLLTSYGIEETLVPRFDAVAHLVFNGMRTVQGAGSPATFEDDWEALGLAPPTVGDPIDAGAGPFYFGNSPYPRDFLFIAERTETDCPYAEFALLPYTHEDYEITLNDFNPIVIYWEFFIKDNPDLYGSTWASVAEAVFNEGLGVYFYSGGSDLEALEREICRYVNGRTFIDRSTGLKEIQLIRGGLDVESLPVILESDLIGEPEIVNPDRSIFVNTFDVNFTDRTKKFDSGALTVQDGAHVASYGVNRQTVDYPWITNRDLATSVAFRDLSGITGAGFSGTFRVSGLRPDLHNGSAFVLDLPSYDVSTVLCRIVSIRERGLRDNSVDVAFIQDTFGINVAPIVVNDLPPLPTTLALPAVNQIAFEIPYYLGLLIGGDDFPAHVEANPAFGQMGLAVAAPNSRHIGYTIAVDAGGGYVAGRTGTFVTYTTLQIDIERMSDTIVVGPIYGIDVDKLLLIGGTEFVRINTIDVSDPAAWVLTVGRGCIDTAPIAHVAGEGVFRVSDASTDAVAYLDGTDIVIAAMTQTTSSILPATSASPMVIDFASRAIRPYPPGKFKIDGSYTDGTVDNGLAIGGGSVLTWVGRDRLLQTDETHVEDHDDGAIGPEDGTTYRITIEALDSGGSSLGLSLDVNVGTDVSYVASSGDFDVASTFARVSVYSIRDGYQSWTGATIDRLFLGSAELEESGDPIITEGGDVLLLESGYIALARVSSASGVNTVGMPSHASGDMIVAFAFRDGSTTPPTVPSGEDWITLDSDGQSSSSFVAAYKIASSSFEGCGTFTNATALIVAVVRGSGTLDVGGSSKDTGLGTAIFYQGLTLDVADGSSMILAFAGHRSINTSLEVPPSPLTNFVDYLDATNEAVAHYQDGPTSFSTVSRSVGGSTAGWATYLVEIKH